MECFLAPRPSHHLLSLYVYNAGSAVNVPWYCVKKKLFGYTDTARLGSARSLGGS